MSDDEGRNNSASRKRTRSRDDDRSTKRYSSQRSNPDGLPLLKILVPSYAAGAIIGKKGADIHALKDEFGVNVEISKNGQVYPGTDDRIMVLTGELGQINDAHDKIIDTIDTVTSDKSRQIRNKDRGSKVIIICPNKTAGLVIGKGGSDIKAMQDETKAKIVVVGRDDSVVFGERTITISGGLDERKEAAQKIASRIVVDSENRRNDKLSYNDGPPPRDRNRRGDDNFSNNFQDNRFGNQMLGPNQQLIDSLSQNPLSAIMNQLGGNNPGVGGGSNNLGSFGGASQGSFGGATQTMQSSVGASSSGEINTRVTIELEIPITMVGFLMGNQGDQLREFSKFSGADIQFLAMNSFNPGCPTRVLTIKGNLNQSQTGYFLVNQKITQARTELGQSGRL